MSKARCVSAWHVIAIVSLFWSALALARASVMRPLTVVDAIETTRLMLDRDRNSVFVSPDGQRYVVMLITGDVAQDGVWVVLMTGWLDSRGFARPVSVARLFTRGLGGGYQRRYGSEQLTAPGQNPPSVD